MTTKQYEKLAQYKTFRIIYFEDGKILNLSEFSKEMKSYTADEVLQAGESKEKINSSGKKKYWVDYILVKRDFEDTKSLRI